MISARNITWLSVGVNIVLTSFKFMAGVLGRSQAMIADAVHSLSDLVTDLAVLIGLRLSSKPQDDDHAYGHGKYEALSAAFIGLVLALVSIRIGWHAVRTVVITFQGAPLAQPTSIAFWAAIVSIVVKETMYHATIHTARHTGNPSLVANAWHHRSDAFSSVATAIGIGAAVFLGNGWMLLDPIAAILVAVLLLRVAWQIVVPQFKDLVDHSMAGAACRDIIQLAHSIPHVRGTDSLRTRMVGTIAVIDLHIHIDPPGMPICEAHEIATRLEDALKKRFGKDTIATIHMEPYYKDFEVR